MENDKLTFIDEEEVTYWEKEFPDLDRKEITEILEIIDAGSIKDQFWSMNPSLSESVVDGVVAKNMASSYEYHKYHTLNNEAD